MEGASLLLTRPMRLIPPRMTAATAAASNTPTMMDGAPKSLAALTATVFAWVMLPVPKLAMTPHTAKMMATGFHFGPSPFSM